MMTKPPSFRRLIAVFLPPSDREDYLLAHTPAFIEGMEKIIDAVESTEFDIERVKKSHILRDNDD